MTNIVLAFSFSEDHTFHTESARGDDFDYSVMASINTWLSAHDFGTFGRDVDAVTGGTMHLETPMYAAAFNYFDLSGFLDMLRSVGWKYPSCVQLFVQEQDDERFRLIEPCSTLTDRR